MLAGFPRLSSSTFPQFALQHYRDLFCRCNPNTVVDMSSDNEVVAFVAVGPFAADALHCRFMTVWESPESRISEGF